jgi:hypothetical protein
VPKNLDRDEYFYDSMYDFARVWGRSEKVVLIQPKNPFRKHNNWEVEVSEDDNITIVRVPAIRIRSIYIFLKNLVEICQKINFRPDIILSHINQSFVFIYSLVNNFNAKFVMGVHKRDIINRKDSIIKRLLKKYFIRQFIKADKIACMSHSIKNILVEHSPEFESKCFVSHLGFDQSISESGKLIEKKSELASNKKRVNITAFSATFSKKEINKLVGMLKSITSDVDWHCTIFTYSQFKYIRFELLKKLNFYNRIDVKRVRNKEETLDIISDSHIFLIVTPPYKYNSFLFEAMAKANLVIAREEWKVEEIIRDGFNGMYMPDNSNGFLNDTIHNYLLTPNQEPYKEILDNTLQTVNLYTIEKNALSYLNEIKKMGF